MKTKRILVIFLIVFIIYIITTILFRSPSNSFPVIVSHRGAAGLAPENTIVGIQKAIEVNADYSEIDIQKTSDGAIVLLHDETIDRTTNGEGKLSAYTLLEIQKLDAGSYFGKEFSNTSIPTIEEVLQNVDLSSISLVIELKNYDLYPGIEQELISLLQEKNITNQVKIISFNYTSLQKTRLASDSISIGLLSIYPINIPHIQEHQVVSTNWLSIILDPTLIYRLHSKGYQVWVWTVNNPTIMKTLVWLGVDGITTDRPDIAIDIINK